MILGTTNIKRSYQQSPSIAHILAASRPLDYRCRGLEDATDNEDAYQHTEGRRLGEGRLCTFKRESIFGNGNNIANIF